MRRLWVLSVLIFLVIINSGCAPKREIIFPRPPSISEVELLDSLLTMDNALESVMISGQGIIDFGEEKDRFTINQIVRRSDNMLNLHIDGPMGMTLAIGWFCRSEVLCIYIPYKNAALWTPLGEAEEDVLVPPDRDKLVDILSGSTPIAHFADSLISFEKVETGYYLTFKKNNEVFVAFVRPNPWHIVNYQYSRLDNNKSLIDVTLGEGQVTNGIWTPKTIEIFAPIINQRILFKIKKLLLNPNIADSLFEVDIPEDVEWYKAF